MIYNLILIVGTTMNNKPIGVIIIATIYVIFGISLPVLMLIGHDNLLGMDAIDMALEHVEWISFLLIAYGLFFCHQWAWWLTTFILMFSFITSGYELNQIKAVLESLSMSQSGILKYTMQMAAVMIMQLVFFIYLWRNTVFDYFGFTYRSRHKKMAVLIGFTAICIGVVFSISR